VKKLLSALEMALMVIGTVLAVASLSFVFFGDTWPFAIAEQLYIGGVTATSLFNIASSLKSSVVDFIIAGRFLLIVPVILGLFSFLRLTRYRWAARYTTSVLTGIGIGLTFGLTIRAQILTMVISTINTMTSLKPDPASAILMLVSTLTILTYYLYSVKYSAALNTGRFKYVVTIGRYFLYASFGYLFAKIYVNEALDGLGGFLVSYIYRTISELRLFLGAV
jgi:hypothetical protein